MEASHDERDDKIVGDPNSSTRLIKSELTKDLSEINRKSQFRSESLFSPNSLTS